MGEKRTGKPKSSWHQERQKNWDKIKQQSNTDGTPIDATRLPKEPKETVRKKRARSYMENMSSEDRRERDRALDRLEEERNQLHDRFLKAHIERSHRMRGTPKQRAAVDTVAREAGIDAKERVRRINILLRARAYDLNYFARVRDEIIEVPMTRECEPSEEHPDGIETYKEYVPKKDMIRWLRAIIMPDGKHVRLDRQQRLYVIGRKKIDFKFRESDYPQYIVHDDDDPETKEQKKRDMENMRLFQAEQKDLADAFEVVSVPLIRGVFTMLGKKTRVYLAGHPDDIAGGLDVVVEFLNDDGSPKLFSDGKPMKLVIDVTYARMRDKADHDLKRRRLSEEAHTVLLDGLQDRERAYVGNARAMKVFRSVVETLGGTMSTQTFDSDGPMEVPQEHVPRLIGGLDWPNAFAAIANWIDTGDEFEKNLETNQPMLANRIAMSINTQLMGLRALAERDSAENPNIPYLTELIDEIGLEHAGEIAQFGYDRGLANIDTLLTQEDSPLKSWQRERLYRAARAQVAYEKRRGKKIRGDLAALPEEEIDTSVPEPKREGEPEVKKDTDAEPLEVIPEGVGEVPTIKSPEEVTVDQPNTKELLTEIDSLEKRAEELLEQIRKRVAHLESLKTRSK